MWMPKNRNTALECYAENAFYAILTKHYKEIDFADYQRYLSFYFIDAKIDYKNYSVKDIMYAADGVLLRNGFQVPDLPPEIETEYQKAIENWAKYGE